MHYTNLWRWPGGRARHRPSVEPGPRSAQQSLLVPSSNPLGRHESVAPAHPDPAASASRVFRLWLALRSHSFEQFAVRASHSFSVSPSSPGSASDSGFAASSFAVPGPGSAPVRVRALGSRLQVPAASTYRSRRQARRVRSEPRHLSLELNCRGIRHQAVICPGTPCRTGSKSADRPESAMPVGISASAPTSTCPRPAYPSLTDPAQEPRIPSRANPAGSDLPVRACGPEAATGVA